MNNYKLLIQYDGGRYRGWQRLGGGENTIQAKIEGVLSRLTGEEIALIGSSRTDAGVHALGQVANFKTGGSFTETEIHAYLNAYLPQDICVAMVEAVPANFHARHNARRKTYLYRIWNREYPNPFLRKYSMHVKAPLDLGAMRSAARYFIGRHDFTAFSNAKSDKKSKVRELYALDISEKEGLVEIRVSGDGFLYNMVRKIAGTLIAVGLGEASAGDVPQMLISKDRSRVGCLADACGLFLESVEY